MTTREQDTVIETLATVHGGAKVLPYDDDVTGDHVGVLACGWTHDDCHDDGGYRTSPWQYVPPSGRCSAARRSEIAYALERADRVAAENAGQQVARDHVARPGRAIMRYSAHDTDVLLRATASDLRDFAAEIIARGHDDQSITREEALLARAAHLDGLARLLPPEQPEPAHSTVTLPHLTAAERASARESMSAS